MSKKEASIEPKWREIAKLHKFKDSDLEKLLADYLKHKSNLYKEIKAIPKEKRTFANTILALENSGEGFSDKFYQLGVYRITHTNKKFRESVARFQTELSQKSVDLEHDKDIYRAILEYKTGNYKREKPTLNKKFGVGSEKLFLDLLREYKKMGFDLPEHEQEKLKTLSKKISALSIEFSKNLDEYTDYILCDESEVKGLPANFLKTLTKENGQYKITLDYPIYNPFIKYADDRQKRREIAEKNYQKGGKPNLKLLGEIVKLRAEVAKLLGYANYVDLSTEERMSKNEKRVRNFLNSLIRKLEKNSKKDIQALNNFAKENLVDYKKVKAIDYYDISYVANKFQEYKYSYDTASLKEYFELEHTLQTMFTIFGDLFNFSITEVQDEKKQAILVDKEVRLYELRDKKSKVVLSYLILDLFPRAGKYGHACSAEFVVGGQVAGKRKIPVNELICNFPKATKKVPALLSVGEVETIFHEFGHALHYMLTEAVHHAQAGYNVVFDFVETPSQMLENFFYEDANLKKLAVHYQTGKVLEKETREKIMQSKNFLNSYGYLRQSIMSIYDIDLHTGKVKDLAKYYRDLLKLYFNLNLPKSSLFPAGFGHLVGGYEAGYYSYLWALVYAYDIFEVFKNYKTTQDLKKVGERYRREILAVGGSRSEMDSVRKFLQRAPSKRAFFKAIQSI